jgi:arylsulfatase A-like enzyme
MMSYLYKNVNILFYISLLTVFFILIEISYFIILKNNYLPQLNILTDQFQIPQSVFSALFFLILAQIAVHLCFSVMVWLIVLGVSDYFQFNDRVKFNLAIIIWILSILTVMMANVFYFPNSSFSKPFYSLFFSPLLIHVVFKILFFIMSAACFISLLSLLISINKKMPSIFLKSIILFVCVGIIVVTIITNFFSPAVDASTKDKPNIILVGVDSLRPDFLSYFGHDTLTPFIDSFLDKAAVFSEAITPLARTFPSWTSILTGEYPCQHGIRTNLARQKDLNFSSTLPSILQQDGYATVYATDETRFSNIGENFGFQQVVTPPMGVNDFLIGTFNDFPLSNLVINTKLGSWLFPYNYANRSAYAVYDPDSFLKRLSSLIYQRRTKPLFLAVHFCLPHHPYSWKDLPEDTLTIKERYQASIGRVDKQLADFFTLMKKNHVLDNAIVVLLSDHGEALELQGDRITEKELFLSSQHTPSIPLFYPAMVDHEEMNRSAGHGTDVLGLPQYHIVLAFKRYGDEKQYQGILHGVVTLLSIKPTLLQWIGLVSVHSVTKSLFNAIYKKEQLPSIMPHIFLESDYSPNAILSINPDIEKVLLDGMKIFQIDPDTTLLTVKDDMYQIIIDSKQYADIYGDWMLALYPQANHLQIPILVNLRSGFWTNDMQSFFARHSPVRHMLTALRKFYGHEISIRSIS